MKSKRPVAGKSKVVGPESRCGICVDVSGKGSLSGNVCDKDNVFFFSAPICVCNLVLKHFILNTMKVWII